MTVRPYEEKTCCPTIIMSVYFKDQDGEHVFICRQDSERLRGFDDIDLQADLNDDGSLTVHGFNSNHQHKTTVYIPFKESPS